MPQRRYPFPLVLPRVGKPWVGFLVLGLIGPHPVLATPEDALAKFHRFFYTVNPANYKDGRQVNQVLYRSQAFANLLMGDESHSYLSNTQRSALAEALRNMGDGLIALELGENNAHRAARSKYARYASKKRVFAATRGWTYSMIDDRATAYNPFKLPAGPDLPTHQDPPYTLHGVTTGAAILALSVSALALKDIDEETSRRFTAFASEVLEYWYSNAGKLFVRFDSGLVGFCYSEFCHDETIEGVAHHPYFSFNSNSLFATAALNLYKLTGSARFLSITRTIASQFKAQTVKQGDRYTWGFGKNGRYLSTQPIKYLVNGKMALYKNIEQAEDIGHAGDTLLVMSKTFEEEAVESVVSNADIKAFAKTLTFILSKPPASFRVDGSGALPNADNAKWLGGWAHLLSPLNSIDEQAAQDLLAKMNRTMAGEPYNYYNLLFDSYVLRTFGQ